MILKKSAIVVATAALTAVMSGALLSPAEAVPGGPGVINSPSWVMNTPFEDDACVAMRDIDKSNVACDGTLTSETSADDAVDVSTLTAEELSLTSAEGVTLATAAKTRKIRTKTWSQTARGITWSEKHTGRVYWDGKYVWSTTARSGRKGYHQCNQGNAVGYDIVVTNCTTEKSPGLVREWDYFQVHILYKGIPIKFSHKMNVWINTGGISNGTIVS